MEQTAAVSVPSLTVKAKFYRGLADASRLAILEALRSGERTVGQLTDSTGLTQSNVSAHLSCLRDCGLVVARQEGRFVHYRLADVRIEQLFRSAEAILADLAEALYACTRYER